MITGRRCLHSPPPLATCEGRYATMSSSTSTPSRTSLRWQRSTNPLRCLVTTQALVVCWKRILKTPAPVAISSVPAPVWLMALALPEVRMMGGMVKVGSDRFPRSCHLYQRGDPRSWTFCHLDAASATCQCSWAATRASVETRAGLCPKWLRRLPHPLLRAKRQA